MVIFKCDICNKEIASSDRNKLAIFELSEVCKDCLLNIKKCTDIMKIKGDEFTRTINLTHNLVMANDV